MSLHWCVVRKSSQRSAAHPHASPFRFALSLYAARYRRLSSSGIRLRRRALSGAVSAGRPESLRPATAFGGQDWRADVTADELILRGAIEPLIIVGIYNTGSPPNFGVHPHEGPSTPEGRQGRSLREDDGAGIEAIHRPRVSHAPAAAYNGIGGSSLGALVSLETGLLYPRIFGRLAILSPSVWWDNRSILEMVRGLQIRCAGAHLAGFGNQRRGRAATGDRRSATVVRCFDGEGMARGCGPVLHRSSRRATQ